ncbi:uncharacterized protein VNE69_06084 [Vairimorpha necatrix]|uniref:Uncharacterized protein n=1 Tax=Vairimorpha necatrix TaxID=6039 RepID=A0AAX4JD27_9MICR
MKLVSWCKPPLKSQYSIPQIPKDYKIFGIKYSSKKMPLSNIKEMVKESFSKYLLLLETSDNKYVEEIENIHLQINEILNENKDLEVKAKFDKLKNETIKEKNRILEEIESEMNSNIF